jgi:thiamine kinase-like enzyme
MQIQIKYNEAIHAMGDEYKNWPVSPIETGLINSSYLIADLNGLARFFLQKINKNVFKDPIAVEENHLLIYQYLSKQSQPFSIAKPRSFSNGNYIFIDSNGEYWRFFDFIMESRSFMQIEKSSQAFEMATVFALFSSSLQFNPSLLKPTIPDFHNLALRYQQFESAITNGLPNRINAAAELIQSLQQRKNIVDFYLHIKAHEQEFPLRVQHHDAKISNILFNKNTNAVIGPVDLDTVMPGYFFSDLGDMIRTTATSIEEGSNQYDAIHIRAAFYNALVDGYSSITKETWTKHELNHKHSAGIIMTYMQCLRFLTDHLQGDTYYKIERPEQNLERALNQYFLLRKLEDFIQQNFNYQIPDSK